MSCRRPVSTPSAVSTHVGRPPVPSHLPRAVMSTPAGDAARRDDASPVRCVETARASASSSPSTSPSTTPSRRKTTTNANERAVNRAAVRRYRERRRTDERERRAECERLRQENEALRLRLVTTGAELKHSRWLLSVVAWKYDIDLADIPTGMPSTSTMAPESASGGVENAIFPAGAVTVRNDVAPPFEPRRARGARETFPRASDDSRPTAAPDELELKHFLEEYFTHGDACPCDEGANADAHAATRGGPDAPRPPWL